MNIVEQELRINSLTPLMLSKPADWHMGEVSSAFAHISLTEQYSEICLAHQRTFRTLRKMEIDRGIFRQMWERPNARGMFVFMHDGSIFLELVEEANSYSLNILGVSSTKTTP